MQLHITMSCCIIKLISSSSWAHTNTGFATLTPSCFVFWMLKLWITDNEYRKDCFPKYIEYVMTSSAAILAYLFWFYLISALTKQFESSGGCVASTYIENKVHSISECARECMCNHACAAYTWTPTDEDSNCHLWTGVITDTPPSPGAECFKKMILPDD